MKRFCYVLMVTIAMMLLACLTVFGAVDIIDTNKEKGIVTIKTAETDIKDKDKYKDVRVIVEKDSIKFQYFIKKTEINVPLNLGTGEYKIQVLEAIGDNKAKLLKSANVKVDKIDENSMFTAAIPLIEFPDSLIAIPNMKDIPAAAVLEKIKNNPLKITLNDIKDIYDFIVKTYTYDKSKAANPPKNYVPVIDEIYAVKKGICYDYSSTLAGVLRSLGVPTRLVMGYKPKDIGDEYHAWNEILINGRWISVDSTFDAALAGVGRAYTIERKYKPDEINILRIY